jgi:thymidylate synthase ThyX
MAADRPPRVITLAPMPPEKCAYALARYSRSPDSIRESLAWVREHDSRRFLEHFYFQYGHSSIADLGHLALCFEGISELAAIEIEDEPLWDGQAKSSRYQDFSKAGFITPPELSAEDSRRYEQAARGLLAAYGEVHAAVAEYLKRKLPRPEEMKPDAYERNINARAFDTARYLLFLGVPTNVGQITSIRTLEKQIRRLRASQFAELRELASEAAAACSQPPACGWDDSAAAEPVAPTLAQWVDEDVYLSQARRELRQWADAHLPPPAGVEVEQVDLLKPADTVADLVATLLYPECDRPFRELYELARSWSPARRREVVDLAARGRTNRDELLRGFRGSLYAFDIVMDIGAYRDLHRHRRCHQYRQSFTADLGYETPRAAVEAGAGRIYEQALESALAVFRTLPQPAAQYLLPFAARSRFLFKMDLAEAEYICRVRSGVKGHFSYRQIAWKMKEKLEQLEPELAGLIEATPPWVEDPLRR